jgi:hypothetical protein
MVGRSRRCEHGIVPAHAIDHPFSGALSEWVGTHHLHFSAEIGYESAITCAFNHVLSLNHLLSSFDRLSSFSFDLLPSNPAFSSMRGLTNVLGGFLMESDELTELGSSESAHGWISAGMSLCLMVHFSPIDWIGRWWLFLRSPWACSVLRQIPHVIVFHSAVPLPQSVRNGC